MYKSVTDYSGGQWDSFGLENAPQYVVRPRCMKKKSRTPAIRGHAGRRAGPKNILASGPRRSLIRLWYIVCIYMWWTYIFMYAQHCPSSLFGGMWAMHCVHAQFLMPHNIYLPNYHHRHNVAARGSFGHGRCSRCRRHRIDPADRQVKSRKLRIQCSNQCTQVLRYMSDKALYISHAHLWSRVLVTSACVHPFKLLHFSTIAVHQTKKKNIYHIIMNTRNNN